jgi:hypothetical protein
VPILVGIPENARERELFVDCWLLRLSKLQRRSRGNVSAQALNAGALLFRAVDAWQLARLF